MTGVAQPWWDARTPRQRRLIFGGAAGVLSLSFFLWALAPRPMQVDTATVLRGPLSVTVVEEARTRVREVYSLSAPIAGRLERVIAEPGDPVKEGETVLVRLRPTTPSFQDRRTIAELESAHQAAMASRDAASADVAHAKADLVSAQVDFDRDLKLLASDTIAPARMDRTRATRDAARAALDAAHGRLRAQEAEVARAAAALMDPADEEKETGPICCIELRAPVDGVVLRLRQESATVLQAGAPVLDIGDPRDLEIYSEVLSADAVAITPGGHVRITGWGGPALEGHVSRVEPAAFTKVSALGIEEQRVNVLINITSPYQEWISLGHDFRVDAHIETWRADNTLQVADAALFRRGDAWATFVVERGRVKQVTLKRGRSNGRSTQVLEGLDEGDRVVLYPPDTLRDSMHIRERVALQR